MSNHQNQLISTATIETFCLNEIGNRANNEDRIYPKKGVDASLENLFIVCDGVGGENDGEIASEIVCLSINEYVKSHYSQAIDGKNVVEKAISFANTRLVDYARKNPGSRRMSTTMSLVLLDQQSILAVWCGDSRIHHIRNGKVIWRSEDHSLVQELVRRGEISQEEASYHPNRNIITRSMNAANTNNQVEFYRLTNCVNGDYILLCTDGFLEQVDDDNIYTVLTDEQKPDKAAEFLKICEGRTRDNFSMYLIKIRADNQLRF